jgi:MFS family permease
MLRLHGFGRVTSHLSPTGLSMGSRQIHYAWVIVALASGMGMVSSSVQFATQALVPSLRHPAGFGWSYGAIAFAFTLQWFVSGLVSPWVGWLGDRYGVRRMMVVGALLFLAGMLLTGTMTQLWQFYLFFGVLLGMATTVFQILLISGLTLWFRTYLGVAMGIKWACQGLGTVLLAPLMVVVFNRWGVQWTFWLPGLAGGTLLLALIRPFYNEPAAIGMRPLGAPEAEPIRRLHQEGTAKLRTKVSCGRPSAPPPSGTSSASISGVVPATISSTSSWWPSPWTAACRRKWRWASSSPRRWSAPSAAV